MALSINKQSITALHVGKYAATSWRNRNLYDGPALLVKTARHGVCRYRTHHRKSGASTVEEYKRDHDRVLVVRVTTVQIPLRAYQSFIRLEFKLFDCSATARCLSSSTKSFCLLVCIYPIGSPHNLDNSLAIRYRNCRK